MFRQVARTQLLLISKRRGYSARFIFTGPILLSIFCLRPDIIPENTSSFLIYFKKVALLYHKIMSQPLYSISFGIHNS